MSDRTSADRRRSLLAALAYFDLFDYPLTLVELGRFRYRFPGDGAGTSAHADILDGLDTPAVGTRDGYYFLAGREAIVEVRKRRYRLAEKKFARARRIVRALRYLPSVRYAAVCNSLALSNADKESDIDLFIVVRHGFLWITRLFVAGMLAALRLRPTGASHADKVCLSFFLSERTLDLSRLALEPDDTYLRYWIATLVPLYDADGLHARLLGANAWVAERLPGSGATDAGQQRAFAPPRFAFAAALPLFGALEPAARRFQMRMFPAEISGMANLDSRVLVSDDILKFHVNDRRAHFERLFREKLREFGLAEQKTKTTTYRLQPTTCP